MIRMRALHWVEIRGKHLPLALLPSHEKLRDGHRDSRECWYGAAPVDSATASSFACGG